jgi:hypothetical protein
MNICCRPATAVGLCCQRPKGHQQRQRKQGRLVSGSVVHPGSLAQTGHRFKRPLPWAAKA